MSTIDERPVANLGRGCIATKRGLTLSEKLTIMEWFDVGSRLFNLLNASAWWIGDWLFFGQWQYGKKYEQGAEVTGLDYSTLRNYASVAGRFDLSRRRDNLSFGHHEAVAALKPIDADRLLDEAEAERWTIKQLRDAVRELRAGAPVPAPAVPTPNVPAPKAELEEAGRDRLHVQFTVPRTRVESWASAAAAVGKDFDVWACDVLDAAATLARAS